MEHDAQVPAEPSHPRYCSQCGTEASPGDRYCRECGSPLVAPQTREPWEPPPSAEPPRPPVEPQSLGPQGGGTKHRVIAIVAAAAALAGAVVVAAVLATWGDDDDTTIDAAATSSTQAPTATQTQPTIDPSSCTAKGIDPLGGRKQGSCTGDDGTKVTVVNQGNTLKLRSLTATFAGIRQAQVVGSEGGFITETASGTFVIISLTVTNRLDEPIEIGGVGTSLTALLLDNGKQYDEDFEASNQALETSFLSRGEPVQPDETVTADVIFDLPSKALRRLTRSGASLAVAPLGEDVNDDLDRFGVIRLDPLGG